MKLNVLSRESNIDSIENKLILRYQMSIFDARNGLPIQIFEADDVKFWIWWPTFDSRMQMWMGIEFEGDFIDVEVLLGFDFVWFCMILVGWVGGDVFECFGLQWL